MPREIRVNLRLNEEEARMLDYIMNVTGETSRNAAARYAIKYTYEQLYRVHG